MTLPVFPCLPHNMFRPLACLSMVFSIMAIGMVYGDPLVPGNTLQPHGDITLSTVPISPETALEVIQQGNDRFVHDLAQHPHQTHKRVVEVSKGQHPFAAVLACADSRLAPELIFDQGIGDLFDVRVAGNVADVGVLGSLEYAVEHLHVPLIVILGHQHCGAVEATLAHAHPHNHVDHIIRCISPATKAIRPGEAHPDEHAAKVNVQRVLQQLRHNPVFRHKLQTGELQIVGGYYSLETGEVEWLTPMEETANHREHDHGGQK